MNQTEQPPLVLDDRSGVRAAAPPREQVMAALRQDIREEIENLKQRGTIRSVEDAIPFIESRLYARYYYTDVDPEFRRFPLIKLMNEICREPEVHALLNKEFGKEPR